MSTALETMLGLAGRVALVTGGGNGIARATALRLATAGCDVAVVDLDPEAAERTATEIRELGREAVALEKDLTVPTAHTEMVEGTVTALGDLSVAVNVCGGTGGVTKSFLDMSIGDWHKPLVLNLDTTFLSCQAEAISMVRGGRPSTIVNVASSSGVAAAPNLAGYGAANAGVVHFTKTAAIELAPYGIRVNCIVPGTHWTAGTRHRATSPDSPPAVREFFTTAESVTPLGHLGEPEETAGVALFLASDLSSYMTGHAVVSDGGILHTTARPAFGESKVPDAIKDHVATR
ncbi:SDR family NAD(P)-dependent oxidoreductase [Actinomadura rudentiformis]|uniref:SDR family oxidoreductase n=1 Tax=Actinomadura rudentiformis TaxID=359158 RepID=A0A6H9YJK3_9ACTN|nr:SDR family NAD(P)-dependent oxidoreductase [Actinomadura rudentiformis]KAB2341545.1 SDR family oxidoreductase [Actinomadura rudentiformis]